MKNLKNLAYLLIGMLLIGQCVKTTQEDIEIAGEWVDTQGKEITISNTEWKETSAKKFVIEQFNNDTNFLIVKDSNQFSKIVWTELKNKEFDYCEVATTKSTVDEVAAIDTSISANPKNLNNGCNGSKWNKLSKKKEAGNAGNAGNLPGTNGNLPGTNGNLPGTNGNLPGTNGNLPGTNGNLPGTNGNLPGTNGNLPGTNGNLPGTNGNLPGTNGNLPGTNGNAGTNGGTNP